MSSSDLRDRLGYAFHDPGLLAQALTHRSYGAAHNERLEFVGDAVLNCVIAAALYERFPNIAEGDLSRVRAHLVKSDTLARLAAGLGVARALKLGEGAQKSGDAARPSMRADALEALFGAVFVDGGYEAARAVIERVYADELARVDPAALAKDPKTELQEWLQARRTAVPEYAVTATSGQPHAQTFSVECRIPALGIAVTGTGTSRRAAEQDAARRAYEIARGGARDG
jgi:ribonuclease-3